MSRFFKEISFGCILISVLSGCSLVRESSNTAPAGVRVAVEKFDCECSSRIINIVQDAVVGEFFHISSASVRTEGSEEADIVIKGRMTMSAGITSQRTSDAAGQYISGITIQAYKGGRLIATLSEGVGLEGGELPAPISLAQNVAGEFVNYLIRKDYVGRSKEKVKIF